MRQADIRTKPKRRGNYVPGKGRPRGSKNRETIELEAAMTAAEQRLRDATPDLAPIDAHGLLTLVYRDGANPIHLRVLAAQAAIRYEKPALSSSQVDATVTLRLGLADELKAAQRRLASVSAVVVEHAASAPGPLLGLDHGQAAACLAESAAAP